MDKITIERETLEALESMLGDFCVSGRATDAMRALSRKVAAALAAQPAEPVAQPYAWHYTNNGGASVWHMGPSNRLDADISASAEFPKVHKVTPVYAAQSDPAAVPLTDDMDKVAIRYAHKMALDLECILAEYGGSWYNTAMQTLGEYRSAMNAIHERESPTFMGEPVTAAGDKP